MTELGVCPDCGTALTQVRGKRGSRYVWCWKCQRALRRGEARAAQREAVGQPPIAEVPREHLSEPPEREYPAEDDIYGHVEFVADTGKPPLKLTVGVFYGDDPKTDIVLDRGGFVIMHPYSHNRMSTEEERAAVGWTW